MPARVRYIRRAEAMELAGGVSAKVWRKWLDAGLITPYYLTTRRGLPAGRAFYRSDEATALREAGFVKGNPNQGQHDG